MGLQDIGVSGQGTVLDCDPGGSVPSEVPGAGVWPHTRAAVTGPAPVASGYCAHRELGYLSSCLHSPTQFLSAQRYLGPATYQVGTQERAGGGGHDYGVGACWFKTLPGCPGVMGACTRLPDLESLSGGPTWAQSHKFCRCFQHHITFQGCVLGTASGSRKGKQNRTHIPRTGRG